MTYQQNDWLRVNSRDKLIGFSDWFCHLLVVISRVNSLIFLPPFPLLENEDTNRIYLIHLLLELNVSICIVSLELCLVYILLNKCY